MTFRGYFALNRNEIANSSRVVAHLGRSVPTTDYALLATPSPDDCALTPVEGHPGLLELPADAVPYNEGGLYYPFNGMRRVGPGLYSVGDCWGPASLCGECRTMVLYDDSWTGLTDWLHDGFYRPEVAPWYMTEIPESAEFGGVWVTKVDGLDTTPVERQITQTVGAGGVAAPHRDATRTVTFDALLIGCTNAGVQYGLQWLTTLLRDTADNTKTRLRYLTAHPGHSAADPDSLVREIHGVVLTKAPEVAESFVTGPGENKQANMYRVTWEMTTLQPYSYLPSVTFDVDWDVVTRQPINWIHAADCKTLETCEDMPVMFSADCVPEEIEVVVTPPPVCGGCMPVGGIDKYLYIVPTQDYAFRGRETAVSLEITNTGATPLTLQAFWRICSTDIRCEDGQWPLQVSGLPAGAVLTLDGVTGRYWAYYDERNRRPIGVVGTPNGAPWRPAVIDRRECWEFIVQTASTSEFTVTMTLADREA